MKLSKEGFLIVFAFLFLCLMPVYLQASQIRTYVLGDIDSFVYNGTGSVDDVYVDSTWLNWANNFPANLTVNDFDVSDSTQLIPFTFSYDLATDEQVISATLTLGLRRTNSDDDRAFLLLSNTGTMADFRPTFSDLGWNSISETETSVCSIDFSNFHGYNMISYLQNGLLDVAVMSNIAVDYAVLTLEIVPEPTTVLLLSFGFLLTRRTIK